MLLTLTAGVTLLAGCSSGSDDASSTTTTADPTTSAAGATTTTAGDADDGGAPAQAQAEADDAGEPIVADGTMEVPGLYGSTAVFEVRNLRVTAPTDATDCPGGAPKNPQRLVASLTAYLRPSDAAGPQRHRGRRAAAHPLRRRSFPRSS